MMRTVMAAAIGGCLVHLLSVLPVQEGREGHLPGHTPGQDDVLSHMKLVYLDDSAGHLVPTIRIEGVNVQIVNGSGSTQTTNSKGNLILGYQASVPNWPRTGSHNLVVGEEHSYTSYGGMVSGDWNQLHGPNSVALAARSCVVRGEACAIVTGSQCEVDGVDNALLSGDSSSIGAYTERCAIVSSDNSTIVDWNNNVILGGQNHSISGGAYNALLGGGGHNLFIADYAGIVGGDSHQLFGAAFAAMLGGEQNHLGNNVYHPVLVGGSDNTVTADFRGTVVGGTGNDAHGDDSTVTGGYHRTAPGQYDWVAGNLFQDL